MNDCNQAQEEKRIDRRGVALFSLRERELFLGHL
jgi:hypothetical protein